LFTADIQHLGANSSLIVFNQTLLDTMTNEIPELQKKRRFSALMYRSPGGEGKRKRETSALSTQGLAIHAQSFNDAFVLATTSPHPSVAMFVKQLNDYQRNYNLNLNAANQLGKVLDDIHETTVLDGLVQFTRSLQSGLKTLNPGPLIRASLRAASTLGETARSAKSNIRMITDSLNMQAPNATFNAYNWNMNGNGARNPTFGPYGTRNPSFRVLAGDTATEKFNSLISFYSLIWNDFKFKKMQMAKTNIAAKVTSIRTKIEKSETLMRSVESYQYFQSRFPTNIPALSPGLATWVENVRTKQRVPLVLALNTSVGMNFV